MNNVKLIDEVTEGENNESAEQKKPSNVQKYYTKEVRDRIREMTSDEMEGLLRGFISTREWIALLKYNERRAMVMDSILRTTNPINDPSTISWAQGGLAGLSDLETYVIEVNAQSDQKIEEKEEERNSEYRTEGIIKQ